MPSAPPHVVVSELAVEPIGAEVLENAFADRVRLVEDHPGFQRLEVWRDDREPGRYLMVSWWDDEASFRSYMRSPEHRTSHARIPHEPARPRPVSVQRFTRIAE